jgi:DNA-binding NtrC family response regulator
MRELKGNVPGAAVRAGMERERLERLLKKHGIGSEDLREA